MMTLLDFARGPALYAAILIMVFGLVWRIVGVFLLPRRRDFSAPGKNAKGAVVGAVSTVVSRSFPRKTYWKRTYIASSVGYAMHFGIFIALLGGAPHVVLFREVFGFAWPTLPKGIIAIASAFALVCAVILLIRRFTSPVLRLISNVDDYISIVLTVLPLLTGFLLAEETFLPYETLLTFHILSVELLMIWLPFGKLAHMFFVIAGRAVTGAKFGKRGATT